MFTRTVSGLTNQHLFHNVDFIVFVEGGTSYTLQEIEAGNFNNESIDILFWRRILNHFKPARYKFKAVGSKSAVIRIAENIIQNDIKTIYAAMDQDFDQILDNSLSHTNIIYTYGYSWENDVWNSELVLEVIENLSAETLDLQIIKHYHNQFLNAIKIGVYADAHKFSQANSFFPRPNGYLRLIECNTNHPTKVKKAELNALLTASNINRVATAAYGRRNGILPHRNCFGHLLGDFFKILVKFLLKQFYNLSSANGEIIQHVALNNFIKNLPQNIVNHYELQLI
ncbi:DUF4435 domain-containing protein [Flavobacterium suncheonense]|uniref:Uncharacterized protein n=1 Tax=Flavobacterium suncheonense GH29-5 = DSM 17707 TaxID=1121899 RepID=A0A0A2MA66_9FLAO|nr:DUF4435 domain-containing protein [Flavobacterium suncheonense]KGO85150.1 hypothetical protein Q764_14215 [Flavobacterium suncheonense GH29-5 = DSM 17707]